MKLTGFKNGLKMNKRKQLLRITHIKSFVLATSQSVITAVTILVNELHSLFTILELYLIVQ